MYARAQHRYTTDAVVSGEIVGGGESMTSAADDDDVVARFERCRPQVLLAPQMPDHRAHASNGATGPVVGARSTQASSRRSCR